MSEIQTKKKVALITGASSGIGAATARLLAENNYDLIVCGRREKRLQQLISDTKQSVPTLNILPLVFDVGEIKEVERSLSSLPEAFKHIDVLINNAGNAHGFSGIEDASIEDVDKMIDYNVKGLLYVSKMIIPQMVSRKSGHIINIGSIAGKEVYAYGSIYCASKHAVDALTKGMRIDLNKYHIKVSAIHPGLVKTEFSLVRFKGDMERAESVYEGYKPLFAEDIAETILFMLSRPNHVNIADVIIFPTAQASSTVVDKE